MSSKFTYFYLNIALIQFWVQAICWCCAIFPVSGGTREHTVKKIFREHFTNFFADDKGWQSPKVVLFAKSHGVWKWKHNDFNKGASFFHTKLTRVKTLNIWTNQVPS